MSRNQSFLSLDPPNELKFRGPFTQTVTSDLTIRNVSNHLICFKVKTTAPKQYCVRPNGGFIEPGKDVKVQVILQPFSYDPNEKNRHKFLVQSITCPPGSTPDDQDRLWKEVTPEQLMDAKLRCVFELPSELTQMASKIGTNVPSNTPMKREELGGVPDSDMQRSLRDNSANRQREMTSQRQDVSSGGFSRGYEPVQAGRGISAVILVIVAILSAILGILLGKFVI